MKKTFYEMPTIEQVEMVVEQGFSASGEVSGPSFGEEDVTDKWE